MTIRSHIVTLVVVALVPLLLFSLVLVLRLNRTEHEALQRATTENVRVVLAAIDRELASSITSLEVLGSSRDLDDGKFYDFYLDARSLLRSHPGWGTISLASPLAEPLMNMLQPFGASLAPFRDPDSIKLVAETRRPVIGSLSLGQLTGKLQFPVRVPVLREGMTTHVLTAVITIDVIARLLEEQRVPEPWIGAILDARGQVLARTPTSALPVGQSDLAWTSTRAMTAPAGWIKGVIVQGTPSYLAYARSPLSGWTVVFGVPATVVDGPLRRSLWTIAGAGLLVTLGGAVAAGLVGRRIARPLVKLSGAAEALGRGDALVIPSARVVEVAQVAQAFAAAADQRAQTEHALRESETRFRAMAGEAQSRWREAEVIAQLSRTINASLDPAIVLQAVADAGRELLACEITRIALWDDNHEAMLYRYTVGTRFTAYEDMRLQPGKGLVGTVITTGRPVRTDDVFEDPRSNPDYFVLARADGVVSGMVVPIHVGSRLEGVIYFGRRSRRPFAEQDEVIGMRVADHAGVALNNADLYQRQQRARAEAEAANGSKDEFLAVLSHELRTPLQSMLGWTRLLRGGRLDQQAAQKALETIDRNTQAQARIIDDLLDISRIVAGKLHIDVRPLNLIAVIGTAVEEARPAASAKAISLTTEMDAAAAEVEGDPQRLQQVLSNLLSNALKFTPAGGTVEVRLERRGERAIIAVRDTGIGIPADVLPYVFDRFRQADSSSTRAHGGLGLGLAIVRHLVELHHGNVRAESAGLNLGTTFVIELPVLAKAASGPGEGTLRPDTSSEESHALGDVRIVVVDDDSDTREFLAEALRRHGATVRCAGSAAEAIEAVTELPADVLVSDISMPGEDGYALVRKVRASGSTGRIPAIALTALARAEDQERALAAGFQSYLAKPVDPTALASVVRALVAPRAPVGFIGR